MANPTLGYLAAQVRSFLSESGTQFFTSDNLVRWINEAQDSIAADCPWLIQTTLQRMTIPYVDSYLLPEDVIEAKATRLRTVSGAPYRLDYVEPSVMDQIKQFGRTSAGVASYTVTYRTGFEGIAVELFPALTSRVRMNCDVFKRPQTLTNDTDICEVPGYLAQVISDYCLWKAKVKDEETAQADRARQTFENDLQDLRSRRLGNQVDQMNKTRSRVGMGWRF